jgi:aromatic ring hydroxylase
MLQASENESLLLRYRVAHKQRDGVDVRGARWAHFTIAVTDAQNYLSA